MAERRNPPRAKLRLLRLLTRHVLDGCHVYASAQNDTNMRKDTRIAAARVDNYASINVPSSRFAL